MYDKKHEAKATGPISAAPKLSFFENDGAWHVISGRRYALRPHVPLDPEKCRLMLGLLNGASSAKKNKRLRRKLLTLALTLAMGMIAPNYAKPAHAAVYTAACNAGIGDTADLIAKIAAANLAGGQNTIALGTNCVYDIDFMDNNYYGPNGLPQITSDITIEGNGAALDRDAEIGDKIRFFYVGKEDTASFPSPGAGSLTLKNLTLSNGFLRGGAGGGGGAGMGGAIFNHGNLYLDSVTFYGNKAQGGIGYYGSGGGLGGGYYAPANYCDSSGAFVGYDGIGNGYGCPGGPGYGGGYGGYGGGPGGFGGGGGNSSNSSNGGYGGFGGGGGFGNYGGAGGFGGGNGAFYSSGKFRGGGGAGLGGAVFNHLGSVTVKNSTFTENYASGGGSDAYGGSGYGAALFNLNGTVTIINSTISDNYVNSGGGAVNSGSAEGAVYNLGYEDGSGDSSATMTLVNTIIANTSGGNDLINNSNNPGSTTATVNAGANNIVMSSYDTFADDVVPGPLPNNPLLEWVQDKGGPTWTMALASNSPAVDAGLSSIVNPAVPTVDQRGYVRDVNVDIGAYEYGAYDYSVSGTIDGGLSESFESGGTFPSPAGLNSLTWQIENVNNVTGAAGFYAETGLGGCGEGGPPAYNIMALPVIDLSGETSVFLEYSWYFMAGFHQDNAAVQISIDNGVTWDTVWNSLDWASNAVYGPNTGSIDISEYAAGQAAVIIRFLYTSVDACQGKWQVDNIKVLVEKTLSLTKTGTGAGTLTADSGAINCGAACLGDYPFGTQVTLTAAPAEGSTFTGWIGCDSVNGLVCTAAMNYGRTVTADFSLTALTTGLIGLWKGEGNAKDSFGTNHGTLQNGATYATGKVGQAFSFDGVNDRVQINSSGIFKGQSEATIEAWVRPKGAHSNDEGFGGQVYAENTGSPDWTRFGIYVFNDGSVHGFGRSGESGAYFDAISTANIPLNQWSHIAATWKADEGIRVYINGIKKGSLDANIGTFTGTNSSLMSIGAGGINAGSSKYVFNGDIDELGIYTRALSASEVLTNYYRANGLVAEWKGDGNAYDSVGNNHGTLNGAGYSSGVFGQAFSFDGVDDYISLPDNLIKASAIQTFEAWFKTSTGGVILGYHNVAYPGTPTAAVPALYIGPNGKLYGELWVGAVSQIVSTSSVNDGNWHQAVLVGDVNAVRLYLDGALVGTLDGTINHLDMSKNVLGIGDTRNRPPAPADWYPFNGSLEEIRFYNRALSAGEITALYAVFSLPPVNGACGAVSGQTLTAAPTSGLCSAGTPSALSGSGPWTWTCQGQNSGTNAGCNANIQTYALNFGAGTNGSITGLASQTIAHGSSSAAVTAVPNQGYHFVNWTGDNGFITTTANPLTVGNITASQTITANFAINTYSLTFVAPNGSITGLASQTIAHGGSSAAVTAVPNQGFHFINWTGDNGFAATAANPLIVSNITAGQTITANFTINTYTVTAGAGPNGKITCAPATVNHGSGSTCTITPDADYQVEGIEVDGVSVGKASVYTMSSITSDCTVTASFTIKKYNLSITKTGSGTVAVSPPGSSCGNDCFAYNKNQRVTVSAKAEKDHIFTGWTGSCTGKGICRLTMGEEKSVTANFGAAAPVISVTPAGDQDFGTVRVGRLKTKTLKITNNGTGNLRIASVEIDGADNDMFRKRSGTAIIKPGKSSNLKVMFKPKATGQKTATLIINSNDPNHPVIETQLGGTGKLK